MCIFEENDARESSGAAMENRLVPINALGPDDHRAEAYKRLAEAIVGGSAPSLTSDELEMLCHDVEAAAKAPLPSDRCLRTMWSLLSTSKGNHMVRATAYRTLADKGARCRFMAFNYVHSNYPGESPALYQQHLNDSDPELLYALSWFIRSHNSTMATHLLIDAITLPSSATLRDTLELEIIGFGEEEHLRRLRGLQEKQSDVNMIKSLADNLETKLRNGGPQCV
jgi:hypothetical protein